MIATASVGPEPEPKSIEPELVIPKPAIPKLVESEWAKPETVGPEMAKPDIGDHNPLSSSIVLSLNPTDIPEVILDFQTDELHDSDRYWI